MNTKAYQITALVLLVLMLALSGLAVVGTQEMAANGWSKSGPYGALYDGGTEIAWRCRTGYAECIPPGRPIPDLKLSLY
jgi:uncharacterized protein YceK